MATAHFSAPPAKRVKVHSANNPQPRWLLVPTASRTVHDLLKSLLLRLDLPSTTTYDLCLDGAPILPDEDIALVRDGEQLQLRQRHTPSPTRTNSQPSLDPPHMSDTSIPEKDTSMTEKVPAESRQKRKRVLTPEGKRRRNVRNRKREKRRRTERRLSQNPLPTPHTTALDDIHPSIHSQDNSLPSAPRPNPTQLTNQVLCNHDEEAPSAAKQTILSSEPPILPALPTERQPVPQVVPNPNGAADQVMPDSPENTTPPDPNSPRKERAQLKKVPNPRLSYVFLQKVSIEPFATNLPQKHSGMERNKHENSESKAIQNTSPLGSPTEAIPAAKQTATDKTSGSIHVEAKSSADKHAAKEVPLGTREEPSAAKTADSIEEPVVAESGNNVSAQNRKRSQERNAESKIGGEENNDEITVRNAGTNEDRTSTPAPVGTDDGCINNTAAAAIHPASKDRVHETSHRNCNGGPRSNLDASKNLPRLKRHRRQGAKSNQSRPDSSCNPVTVILSDEQTPSSQRSDPDQLPTLPNHPTKAGSSVTGITAAGTKPSTCDVINLVDEDEDDARSFDSLPVFTNSRNTENCPKSTSPQSIVLSPAEPPAKAPITAHLNIEVETGPSQLAKENVHFVVRAENEERHPENEPGSTRASRRKPLRPRRLKKPETDPNSAKTRVIASRETSERNTEQPETLEVLKQAVVRDLEGGKPSGPIQDKNLPPEKPVLNILESGKIPNTEEASKPGVRNDTKKKRNALKGGLSISAALRVAKAHNAMRLSSPKQKKDINLQDSQPGSSNGNTSLRESQTMDLEARSAKKTIHKKSKRSKRLRKVQQYLNEVQENRSTFVGYGGSRETLLPPLELLELPEGLDKVADNIDVRENLAETQVAQSHSEAPPDVEPEAAHESQRKPCYISSESPSLAAVATEENRSNIFESFNGEERMAEEPAPALADDSEMNNNDTTQQASQTPRERDKTRNKTARTIKLLENSAAKAHPIQSTNVDGFREDLVHMLQHTTQTLAKTWSRWENC